MTIPPIWERITEGQQPLTTTAALILGVGALVLFRVPVARRLVYYLVTIAHEGGHGLFGALVGGRVTAVHLRADGSGAAYVRSSPRQYFIMLMGGYPAPSLFGLGASALLAAGYASALLWALLLLLIILLMFVRNWFALLPMLGVILAVFAVSWFLPVEYSSAFAYLITWILLIGGPLSVIRLYRQFHRRHWQDSDPGFLANLTGVNGLVWVLLFLLIDLGALTLGTYWILT